MASNPSSTPVTQTPTPTVAYIKSELRLGRNPIPPPAPGKGDSYEYKKQVRLHENYQRLKLHGFTIKELQLAGCFGDSNDKPSNLPQIIHPLFELIYWCSDDQINEDIGNGFLGKWNIHTNQIVKDAMLPVLYLATAILKTTTPWPWFDALFMGERRPVPPEDCPDGCDLSAFNYDVISFHVRQLNQGPSISETASRLKNVDIPQILSKDVSFHIRSAVSAKRRNPSLGLAWGRTRAHRNNTSRNYGGSEITISSEGVMPLLWTDLSISERLAQQFVVAKTLCHEIMHMFGQYIKTTNRNRIAEGGEPFFEDEAQTELGTSWEANTFGGKLSHMHGKDDATFDQLALGTIVEDWPSFFSFGTGQVRQAGYYNGRFRNHRLFDPPVSLTYWPIPGVYVETLHQASFWDSDVIKYGADSLFAPRVIGNVVDNVTPRANLSLTMPDLYASKPTTRFTPLQTAAEKARDTSLFKSRVAAHRVTVQQIFQTLAKRQTKHNMLNQWDQRDKDFHQACINDARSKSSKAYHKQQVYDIFDALRESGFPFIRIQANYYLGVWGSPNPHLDLAQRVYLLQNALIESVPLAQRYPNDPTVVQLDTVVQQARVAVAIEQQTITQQQSQQQ